MIYTMQGSAALGRRTVIESPGTGLPHWGTVYFGPRSSTSVAPGPQTTMTEMAANETIVPHFHGITQFQIFAAGSGTIGKNAAPLQPLTLQYKDHHTAYGPVVAGAQGLTFFALRIKTGNSAPVYLDRPGYRDQLQPSPRRNLISAPLGLSIEPVLQHRNTVTWEPIFVQNPVADGMDAHMVRMGAGQTTLCPDPSAAGGYYVFVANGSMVHDGAEFGLWSMIVVERNEAALPMVAGPKGLEALVMVYPREADDYPLNEV
jgi:hypothetical protein